MTVLLLLASFVLIVGGALLFTNGVEWLGHRLNLGEGAVGSLLAAVGTALPESLIPVVALLAGAEGEDVAIGAIIGAPFMLGTIAMFLVGLSAVAFRGRRESGREIHAHLSSVHRDLGLFLVFFPLGIVLGLIESKGLHYAAAAVFVIAYAVYAWYTVRGGGETAEAAHLRPLTFDTTKHDPPSNLQIAAQVILGLALIIGGAELFVEEVTHIAEDLGVDALILSLILAPLATELPEKANSFLWVKDSKDELAIGNITGAMAFQSTVPVALGLVFTEWALDEAAIAAGIIGVAGGMLALWRLRARKFDAPHVVAWAVLFATFVAFVAFVA
jgi:cation:H+ antiporter